MALIDLGYNTYDDQEQDPWGLPIGYGGVSEQDVNDYYDQVTPQTPDYGTLDMTPYEYGGWRPTTDQGTDYPNDQYLDWYYNNEDAQPYIDDWWTGGDGDVSQPPTAPPQTTPSAPPVTGGDGAYLPPFTGSQPSNVFGTAYGPGSNFPSITTAEPLQMSEQDRMYAAAQGDLLDQGFRDSQNRYEDWEGFSRDQAWNGPGGYANILAGNGGYSPEDSANILQKDMLMGGMAGDAEYAANFLSPEEIAAMQGNPYAARDMAAGKLGYLDQWLREGDAAQRGAVSALDTDLNAAVDPLKLGLSDEYKANFNFGQGDADLLADQAGRIAGTNALAREMQLRDAAFAQGNTSPIALEAARGRTGIYGDIAAADAVTDARLKGKGLMLDVTRNREMDRLGSERDISGRQRDIASEIRQTQLGTEKGISDAWNNYGRYNTDLMVNTTGQAEAAAAQRAGALATNRQGANQANINTRFGQAGTASTALSGRYGQIAGQKKAEEQEGRGFLTGQQDRAQQGAQQGQGNRLSLYGARNSAQQGATNNATSAKNLPGFFDKLAGFAGGVMGG